MGHQGLGIISEEIVKELFKIDSSLFGCLNTGRLNLGTFRLIHLQLGQPDLDSLVNQVVNWPATLGCFCFHRRVEGVING